MRAFLVTLLLACLLAPALADSISANRTNERRTLKAGDRLELLGNYCNITVDGTGGQVQILGNYNNLIVTGDLESVQVLGNFNTVYLTPGRREPKIERLGQYNQVEYGEP
ncbi:MAG: hypothetical protein AB1758_35340 [Candidatus Eremiobacterota bacterium]